MASDDDDSVRSRLLQKLAAVGSGKGLVIKRWQPSCIADPAIPLRESRGGKFGTLPLELVHNIFSLLDFKSLASLRLVNYVTKVNVESLPAYERMVRGAKRELRALVKREVIANFSAGQLYDVLNTDRCAACDRYGPFLFLLTCQRYCYSCLSYHQSTRALTVLSAMQCYGISRRALAGTLKLHSIPGQYGPSHKSARESRRLWLVSAVEAEELAIELHGSASKMEEFVETKWVKRQEAYSQRQAAWSANSGKDARNYNTRQPVAPINRYPAIHDSFSYMASVRFPSFDCRAGKFQRGCRCPGCYQYPYAHRVDLSMMVARYPLLQHDTQQLAWHEEDIEQRVWNEKEILQHLRDCPGLKRALEEDFRGSPHNLEPEEKEFLGLE